MSVAVVGAGFVGSFFSFLLAKKGFDVKVYERLKEVGRPHCSGLLGISGLRRIGLLDFIRKRGLALNEIRGAKFYTLRNSLIVESKHPVALVVDRVGLDREIAGLAVDSGAELLLGKKVEKISVDGTLLSAGERRKFNVIADAEGAQRSLIRGLPGVHLKGLLPAYQMDVQSKVNLPEDFVEVYLVVPDFFLWLIPLGDNMWRIGGATKVASSKLLSLVKLIAKKRFGAYKTVSEFGGIVVSGGPIKRFVWGRIIAIGDAAGQVKQTTGGGVVMGGLSAKLAAEAVENFLIGKGKLEDYERRWRKVLGQQFRFMGLMRKLLNFLGPAGLSAVTSLIPEFLSIEISGDFDFHGSFLNPFAEKTMKVRVSKRNIGFLQLMSH